MGAADGFRAARSRRVGVYPDRRGAGMTGMAIMVNIDVMLAKRKMSVTELAERVGITIANISVLKNGKAKAIRFSTLEAVCTAFDCQPGDILAMER